MEFRKGRRIGLRTVAQLTADKDGWGFSAATSWTGSACASTPSGGLSLARLDLGLNEDERSVVLKAFLGYRARSKTFWQDMTKQGITDRREQLVELKKLRGSFEDEIRGVVPDGEMGRLVVGLLGGGTDPGQGGEDSRAKRPPR